MTVISDPPTARAARVSLAPGGSGPGPLDGAWWPRSRDLVREIPPLAAAFEARWERFTRAAVNPAFWDAVPKKIPLPGRVIRVGWFTDEQDPHALLLLSGTVRRWDLLVIPPGTPSGVAARLMAAAADPGNVLTAGALLDRARAEGARSPEADWESEGGRTTA